MFKFVAMWNIRSGLSEAEFERWYKDTHIEDAKRIPGLVKYTVNRISGGSQSGAPYYRMAELCFANEESFQKAFGSAELSPYRTVCSHLRATSFAFSIV